jgi:hypothetical protein
MAKGKARGQPTDVAKCEICGHEGAASIHRLIKHIASKCHGPRRLNDTVMEARTEADKTAKKDYEDMLHEFKALRHAAKDDPNDKLKKKKKKKKVSK